MSIRSLLTWIVVGLALVLALGPWIGESCARYRAGKSQDRQIAILCYHDVSDDRQAGLDVVSPAHLRAQIRSARRAGFRFLTLGELLAYRDQPEMLPPRVMVLTFDDGYRSFVERALPVLRKERVPATLAVVTSWFDRPPERIPPLMTWDDIRTVRASGLVEIASHSHDLHRYDMCNPWRDTRPSVSTRRFRPHVGRYENRNEYRVRVRDDLAASQRTLEDRLGRRARFLVWPYGEHNVMARTLAREAGFEATLSLGGRLVTPGDLRSGTLPRFLMTRDNDSSTTAWLDAPPHPIRGVQVDLDVLYDPDTLRFAQRVDGLARELRAAGVTHVFLQACPDPRGDDMPSSAWFANHQMPVRADVWSMVARKLQHASIQVWVRAPVMNLAWLGAAHPEWGIPVDAASEARDPHRPFRLAPDLAEARRAAVDFYADLAVYLPIDGVLFDDDACMRPGERLRLRPGATLADRAAAVDSLLEGVRGAVRDWRPDVRFGRVLHASVVESDGIDPEYAQDFTAAARANDLTVVRVDARGAGHEWDAEAWAVAITARATARAESLGRGARPAVVMIEIESHDDVPGPAIPGTELSGLLDAVRLAGASSLGIGRTRGGAPTLPPGLLAPRLADGAMTSGEPRY